MKTLSTLFCAVILLTGCTAPISEEEKEFNDSGSAKAIEDITDLWQFYEDTNAGLTIKYPNNVTLNGDDEDSLRLRISSESIDGLEGTMGFNEETARGNMEKLRLGVYGKNVDSPIGASMRVRNIGDTNAQEFMVLSRFEVCSVTFERKLYFFHNNNQIVITLVGPKSIVENSPEYFTTNEENCGTEQIWNFEKQNQFYTDLASNQGSAIAQEWFDTFEDIVDTIELNEPTNNPLDALQGTWTSDDDEKSVIEFSGNRKIDFYEDEKMSEGVFEISDEDGVNEPHLTVSSDNEVYEYEIIKLSNTDLWLMYMPRGNILRYTR